MSCLSSRPTSVQAAGVFPGMALIGSGGDKIVTQVIETEWYVAVPPVAQPGEYSVVSKPLGRREAFKACKELNELEEADWSEATRNATRPDPPGYRIM